MERENNEKILKRAEPESRRSSTRLPTGIEWGMTNASAAPSDCLRQCSVSRVMASDAWLLCSRVLPLQTHLLLAIESTYTINLVHIHALVLDAYGKTSLVQRLLAGLRRGWLIPTQSLSREKIKAGVLLRSFRGLYALATRTPVNVLYSAAGVCSGFSNTGTPEKSTRSLTRVTKRYLLALGTTQISSFFTKSNFW